MTSDPGLVLVAGAGGFIGGHLVASLLADGQRVRAVDVKPLEQWYQIHSTEENVVADLRLVDACHAAVVDVTQVSISHATWGEWASSSTTRHCAC